MSGVRGRVRSYMLLLYRTLKKKSNIDFIFQNCNFYLNLCYKNVVIWSREPEPVAGTGQDWTGSTTLTKTYRIKCNKPERDGAHVLQNGTSTPKLTGTEFNATNLREMARM